MGDVVDNEGRTLPADWQSNLLEAARRVVWFDWGDNDPDAQEAIEDLRKVLATAPGEGGGE